MYHVYYIYYHHKSSSIDPNIPASSLIRTPLDKIFFFRSDTCKLQISENVLQNSNGRGLDKNSDN